MRRNQKKSLASESSSCGSALAKGAASIFFALLATLFATNYFEVSDGNVDAFLIAANITTRNVKLERRSSSSSIVATSAIRKGEKLFSIPRHLCITDEDVEKSSIGQRAKSLGTALDRTLDEGGAGFALKRVFLFAMYLVRERRSNTSRLQKWFDIFPSFGAHSGALFWDEEELECLDSAGLWEARAARTGLSSSLLASKLFCRDENACGGSEPTLDEMRWGLATYFHYNLRDQVIVPFVTFAHFSTTKHGMEVTLNRVTGDLEITSGDNIDAHEEITLSFPRGPSSQLIARGVFDSSSLGVDSSIDISSASSDPVGRKHCHQNYHELMFGSNGRPRDALLSCLAWLLADSNQRKNFNSHRGNVELIREVFEDLETTLSQAIINIPSTCAAREELQDVFSAYRNFTKSVLESNLHYVKSQLSQLRKQ